MNIAFFLIPKKDVVWLNSNASMRQALKKWNITGIQQFH